MQITSIRYPHPVNRLPGGNVCVSVEVGFDDGLSFSGIGLSPVDSEEGLSRAFEQAVANAVANRSRYASSQIRTAETVRKIVSGYSSEKAEQISNQYRGDPEELERRIRLLDQPATEAMQAKIDEMCEALGIDSISLGVDDPDSAWRVVEVLVLTDLLSKKLSYQYHDIDKTLYERK